MNLHLPKLKVTRGTDQADGIGSFSRFVKKKNNQIQQTPPIL